MRLAWNMAGAGAFIAWQTVCGILMFGFLKVSQSASVILAEVCQCLMSSLTSPLLQAIKLFRVHPSHEIQGLDMVKHNEPAYPIGKITSFSLSLSGLFVNQS